MRTIVHPLPLLAVICSVLAAFARGDEAAQPDGHSAGWRMVRVPQVERMHCLSGRAPQEAGYELICPGARIPCSREQTQHPALGMAAAVEKLDETHLRITLTAPLPEEIGAGDTLRNADWQPTAATEPK
ncbi:MAG: hypothetical protein J1E42_05820 [Akkermansiaceae bacterium]|nr:hypothetical protein [Akkermansiaceae bacterium]